MTDYTNLINQLEINATAHREYEGTERRRAAAALRDLQDRLNRLSESVRTMLQAHDDADRVLEYVLMLRMYGEEEQWSWDVADRLVEGLLRREEPESPLHDKTVEQYLKEIK